MSILRNPLTGLGARLRAVREKRGVSVRSIANALGTTTGTVGGWEDGKVPMLSTIYVMADMYNLTIDELIGRPIPSGRLVRLLEEAYAKATGGITTRQEASLAAGPLAQANGSDRLLIHDGPPPVPGSSPRDPNAANDSGGSMARSVSGAGSVSGKSSSSGSKSSRRRTRGSGVEVPEVQGPPVAKRGSGRPRKVVEDPNRTIGGLPDGLLAGLDG